ncbi:PA0069 family radical SAM protein [Azospirillum sp. TSO35-2]|uniref:PA0069 family radical SAM protein n=1 Tax=Azospirillum sp. TSO35-2 TaxID=716796 RepID=UPI000D60EDFF|nr:PA0069 family radical SAM protein [Azospirillum sp. TSO35-2]PWC32575.1 DNA repair photolyase [Azospirillum sp. TSO35-2]
MDEIQRPPMKGRGAVSNATGRYERDTRVLTDDGWSGDGWGGNEALSDPIRTIVAAASARSIITRNQSPDVAFDQSVNPYQGCEHACIYCFARPTHAYLGLSPGLDFETRLFAKRNAAELLAKELRAKSYVCQPLALGANTDPYQPIERTEGITRRVLEVCRDFRQPVCLITKSALVLRDLDILAPMAADGLATVSLSVTTLDRELARVMEPRASTPGRRIDAIRALNDAGVPVSVLASPMIPALNDHELEAILEAAVAAGATGASYILLRLPLEIADLFEEWLRVHAPNRADRVLSLMRQSRDGALYRSGFGTRMKGSGPYAELLRGRFAIACKRLGLGGRHWQLDCSRFRPPPAAGDQLSLL